MLNTMGRNSWVYVALELLALSMVYTFCVDAIAGSHPRAKRGIIDDAGQKAEQTVQEIKENTHHTNMNEITPYLYLGGYWSVTAENMQKHQITALVNLNTPFEEPEASKEAHLAYKSIEAYDLPVGSDIQHRFVEVTSWMEEERRKHNGRGKILVVCMEGVGRSGTIVLAYLLRYDYRRWSLQQYHDMIHKLRKIRIQRWFRTQLEAWVEDLKRIPDVHHQAPMGHVAEQQRQQKHRGS